MSKIRMRNEERPEKKEIQILVMVGLRRTIRQKKKINSGINQNQNFRIDLCEF